MVENKIAIVRNHEALKRILAGLVAMAGWTAAGGTLLRASCDVERAANLPRHLHLAILRLLRPAEAATRRLVIVLARGIVVTLPPLRPAKPKPGPVLLKNGKGTGIVNTGISIHRLGLANVLQPIVQKRAASPTRPPAFPLLDPLRNPFPRRPRRKPGTAVPSVSGFTGRRSIPLRRLPSRMTRSTPRVLVSALPPSPRRWTTCRPRLCASRAGLPAETGCAGSHLPPADFAASGRCGRAARRAAACPVSIRSPGG